MEAKSAVTINLPVETVYQFWHDFENLPRFMLHLEHVEVTGSRRSHWVVRAPGERTVEWDAEIVDDVVNERIEWRSMVKAEIPNRGVVEFRTAPGDRGTELSVELSYDAPAGPLGRLAAKIFGEEPAQQIRDDLRRFKQILETGEVLRSDGSPEGIGDSVTRQHPAQPAAEARP